MKNVNLSNIESIRIVFRIFCNINSSSVCWFFVYFLILIKYSQNVRTTGSCTNYGHLRYLLLNVKIYLYKIFITPF